MHEVIFSLALATPSATENLTPTPQNPEPVIDLERPSTQGKRPPYRVPPEKQSKRKRRKTTKDGKTSSKKQGGDASQPKKSGKSPAKETFPKTALEQPKSFAGNKDISSAASYFLSIYPEGETSR
ncbi:keratin [Striga asiatica]|uniref:Keratin n=1 Tax=Striga asiatica TaxID=4170 RepID=A0A5A7QQY2_STRAF|nr:keratin [Striga asiatica]